MRKFFLLMILLFVVGSGIYYGVLFFVHKKDPNFMAIDTCMDHGGCWDSVENVCRKDESNAQELCDRFIGYRIYKLPDSGNIYSPTRKEDLRARAGSFSSVDSEYLDQLFKHLPEFCKSSDNGVYDLVLEIQSSNNESLYKEKNGNWFHSNFKCSFDKQTVQQLDKFKLKS